MPLRILFGLWIVIVAMFAAGSMRAYAVGANTTGFALLVVVLMLLSPIPVLSRREIASFSLRAFCFLEKLTRKWYHGYLERKRRAETEREERDQRIKNDATNREVLFLKSHAAPHLMLGLQPVEFEQFVLRYFRVLGFEAHETKVTGDGGVDGFLKRNNELFVLQCKRWAGQSVGEPSIRDLLGAVTKHGAQGGIFVTTSEFAPSAVKWAAGTCIELIDGELLAARIKSLPIHDPASGINVINRGSGSRK